MRKFNVGDKVVCVDDAYNGKFKKGDIQIIKRDGGGMIDLEDPKQLGMAGWNRNHFKLYVEPVAPAEQAVVRLRVIEAYRPAGLRLGAIVTLVKENATTYLLKEFPGKLFKKARFERIDAPVAAPDNAQAPRKLKVGDAVICVGGAITFQRHGGEGGPMSKAIENKIPLTVTDIISKRVKALIKGGLYSNNWALEDLVFADGSPIEGGAPVAQPVFNKKVNRPLVKGDRVVITKFEDGWGGIEKSYYPDIQKAIDKGTVFTIKKDLSRKYDGEHFIHPDNVEGNVYCPVKWLEFAGPQHVAITKAPPEVKLGNILDVLDKAEGTSLNDFVIHAVGTKEYTKYFNAPCFARLRYVAEKGITQLAVSLKNAFKDTCSWKLQTKNIPHFKRWLEYIYNDSPWKDCFINKRDVEELLTNGYEMNCEKGISQLVGAAIAIRDGYEHQERLTPFVHFLDEGYDGNTAYLMAFMLHYNGDAWTVGRMSDDHSNMNGCQDAENIFKFFREGYHLKCALDEKPANKEMKPYMVKNAIAKDYGSIENGNSIAKFLKKHAVIIQKGDGWGAKEFIKEESIKTLADAVQAKLKG